MIGYDTLWLVSNTEKTFNFKTKANSETITKYICSWHKTHAFLSPAHSCTNLPYLQLGDYCTKNNLRYLCIQGILVHFSGADLTFLLSFKVQST